MNQDNQMDEDDLANFFCKGCGFEWDINDLDFYLRDGKLCPECPECGSNDFSISEPDLPTIEEYQIGYKEGD